MPNSPRNSLAMAATAGLTLAWTGTAAICAGLVLVIALAVRPSWRYDTRATPPQH